MGANNSNVSTVGTAPRAQWCGSCSLPPQVAQGDAEDTLAPLSTSRTACVDRTVVESPEARVSMALPASAGLIESSGSQNLRQVASPGSWDGSTGGVATSEIQSPPIATVAKVSLEEFRKLEARVLRLERLPQEVDELSRSVQFSAAQVKGRSDNPQGIASKLLNDTMEAVHRLELQQVAYEKAVEQVKVSIEGKLSAIWTDFYGELQTAVGQDSEARLAWVEGHLAALWECVYGKVWQADGQDAADGETRENSARIAQIEGQLSTMWSCVYGYALEAFGEHGESVDASVGASIYRQKEQLRQAVGDQSLPIESADARLAACDTDLASTANSNDAGLIA